MPHVMVRELVKTYRIAERRPGLLGAVRGVFSRSYREVRALASVSFSVERGELLGFIGPNGAGKSTTIKILSGILQPTSGVVEVAGLSPFADRVRHVANIGVVCGQRTQLWWDLPVFDGLHLLREIFASTRYVSNAAARSWSAYSASARCWRSPCGSSRSGSACAWSSPRRCCTNPSFYFSMSPPSDWILHPSWRRARSSSASIGSEASP